MARTIIRKFNQTVLFVQEALQTPKQIGAIAPSGSRLAASMADWLCEKPSGYVLELGPGTGAVTEWLIRKGLPQEKLVAVEMSKRLVEHLKQRYPLARILTGDAFEIEKILESLDIKPGQISMVFSSLPLLNFPRNEAMTLADKLHDYLEPGGKLVMYTYHLGKKTRRPLGRLQPVSSNIVWLNLPPARVSVHIKP